MTERLAKIGAKKEPAMLDIGARQLDRTQFGPDQAVLDVSGTENADYAAAAFDREIQAIFGTRREPPVQEEDGSTIPQRRLKIMLKAILDRYHQTFVQPYDGISRGRLIALHQRIVSAVEKFGTDADKQVVYNVYKAHLKDSTVTKNPRYVQNLMLSLYRMRDHGVLKKKANLTAIGVLGHADKNAVWTSLHIYTQQKLAAYAKVWFKSSDRREALDEMRRELKGINEDTQITDREKVTKLINLVEDKSREAIQEDQTADKKKWLISSLRNKNGSRFQMALDGIHGNAMLAATGLMNEANKEDKNTEGKNTQDNFFNVRLNALHFQLVALKKRAKLPHLKTHARTGEPHRAHESIETFIRDTKLNQLIKQLNETPQSNIKQRYQVLQAIEERLFSYQQDFRKKTAKLQTDQQDFRKQATNTKLQTDSETTFLRFFNDVYDRVYDMKMTLEYSVPREPADDFQDFLRDKVQEAVQRLVIEDYVKDRGIDTSAYENMDVKVHEAIQSLEKKASVKRGIDTNKYSEVGNFKEFKASPEKQLTHSILFEIQRHVHLQQGNEASINFKFTDLFFNLEKGTLAVWAEFTDKEKNVHQLSLQIDNLPIDLKLDNSPTGLKLDNSPTKQAPSRHLPTCQWLEYKVTEKAELASKAEETQTEKVKVRKEAKSTLQCLRKEVYHETKANHGNRELQKSHSPSPKNPKLRRRYSVNDLRVSLNSNSVFSPNLPKKHTTTAAAAPTKAPTNKAG